MERLQGLVERYGGSTTEIIELEKREAEAKEGKATALGRNLEEQLRRNEELQKGSFSSSIIFDFWEFITNCFGNWTPHSEIDTLRNENALMEKEIEALELQNDRLTYDHGNGHYDPKTTKVLELRSNPDLVEHAVRTSTLERLKEENKVLLERVADLEKLKGSMGENVGKSGAAMVPRESFMNVQAELDASQAVVRQKETMEDRLKQVCPFPIFLPWLDFVSFLIYFSALPRQAFSAKADEFRKAVLALLGYRLDFLSSGRVKVSSIYAPNKDHSLLFSSASGGVGTMELVGAGSDGTLSDEVRRQVRFWVGERQSIPGFLASLTLTMFEDTTKGGSAGFVSSA